MQRLSTMNQLGDKVQTIENTTQTKEKNNNNKSLWCITCYSHNIGVRLIYATPPNTVGEGQ